MDISLNFIDVHYNIGVSAYLVYQNQHYIRQDKRPVSTTLHFGETLEMALHRVLKVEFNLDCVNVRLCAIIQDIFKNETLNHEHNIVYKCELEAKPISGFEVVEDYLSESEYLLDDVMIYPPRQELHFKSLDLSQMMGDEGEFNVRISAIIERDGQYLFDCGAYDPQHRVVIGGRMQIGESFETALKREVKEELGLGIQKSSFLGVGEDFFTLKVDQTRTKRIHFISFIYKVVLEDGAIVFDDGCVGAWLNKDDVSNIHMKSILPYLK